MRIKTQPANIEHSAEPRRRRVGFRPRHHPVAEWLPDKRRPDHPAAGDDPGIVAASDHPFLDYDPVMPDWPR